MWPIVQVSTRFRYALLFAQFEEQLCIRSQFQKTIYVIFHLGGDPEAAGIELAVDEWTLAKDLLCHGKSVSRFEDVTHSIIRSIPD